MAYTSALAAGAALAAHLGPLTTNPAAARELLEHATQATYAAPIAGCLGDRRIVLCAEAQADRTTARELALKVAGGARMATLALELETVLNGQLAAHEPADNPGGLCVGGVFGAVLPCSAPQTAKQLRRRRTRSRARPGLGGSERRRSVWSP